MRWIKQLKKGLKITYVMMSKATVGLYKESHCPRDEYFSDPRL